MSDVSYLSHARYGKDKVRVLRVVRDGAWHNIVEYNVTVLVEGDIDIRSVSPYHELGKAIEMSVTLGTCGTQLH